MIHQNILLPTELITHPDLKPQALRLITYILMQTDEDDRSFELNTSQWAKDLHCAASTIRRWMARLVEIGMVTAKGIVGRVKQFFYAGFSSAGSEPKSCPSPRQREGRRDVIPAGRGGQIGSEPKSYPSPLEGEGRRDVIPAGRGGQILHQVRDNRAAKKETELRAFDATLPQAEKKIIIRRVCNRVSRELGYSDGTPEYLRLADRYYREEVSWLKEMTFCAG